MEETSRVFVQVCKDPSGPCTRDIIFFYLTFIIGVLGYTLEEESTNSQVHLSLSPPVNVDVEFFFPTLFTSNYCKTSKLFSHSVPPDLKTGRKFNQIDWCYQEMFVSYY